ncbi:MAG: alpha/beta hydrolase-fold protein [Rhodothermales bacterium]
MKTDIRRETHFIFARVACAVSAIGILAVVAVLAMTVAACGGSSADRGTTASADTLQLAPLPPFRSFNNCTADIPESSPCRFTDAPRLAEVERRLNDDTAAAWGGDDRWTIAYRAPDDSVTSLDVMGGVQLPMSRIEGTRLWALALRLPGADSAVIATRFLIRHGRQFAWDTTSVREWRGKDAPPKPVFADGVNTMLAGTIEVDSLWSDALQAWRKLTIYLPPGHTRERRIPVVYFADGQTVGDYSRVVDPLIASGELRPVALIGVWVSRGTPSGGPPRSIAEDLRSIEYHEGVESVPGADSAFVVARYRGHKRFFTEEVRRWAEDSLFVSTDRRWRGVHGSSSGGHFALTLGRERPDLYGFVIANSNSIATEPPAGGWQNAPRYYVSAGILEQPTIKKSLTSLGDSLSAHGIPNVVNIYYDGHDSDIIGEELPRR